jgi:hypothetical protein
MAGRFVRASKYRKLPRPPKSHEIKLTLGKDMSLENQREKKPVTITSILVAMLGIRTW